MAYGHDGMRQQHPWARIAHYGAGKFPWFGFIAVHRALVAGGLVLAIGAAVQAGLGIVEEGLTFITGLGAAVVVAAIDANHGFYGRKLPAKITAQEDDISHDEYPTALLGFILAPGVSELKNGSSKHEGAHKKSLSLHE